MRKLKENADNLNRPIVRPLFVQAWMDKADDCRQSIGRTDVLLREIMSRRS